MMIKQDMETLAKLKASDKPVMVYGNMNTARCVCRMLQAEGICPRAFVVDSYAVSPGQTLDGLAVQPMDEAVGNGKCNVVIGFDNIEKTRALFSLSKWLVFDVYHLMSAGDMIVWDAEFCKEHAADFVNLRKGLADGKSRRILDALVAVRTGGTPAAVQDLLSVADSTQYFNELTFSLVSESDVFFDCGAFDGDTILKYAAFTGGRYKQIVAFEPLQDNLAALRLRIQATPRIMVVEQGTWNVKTQLHFKADTSASFVAEEGELTIPVTTIDEVADGQAVSFIKMDVEGSECETLLGARKTIERWHPKLAVCVYHKADDLFKCHELIRCFGGERYRFFLRHHSNRLSETVLYAIPDESNMN